LRELQSLHRIHRPVLVRDPHHELEGLPAPVQRYFRAVLKDGQRIIVAATLCDRSHVRLSVRGELQDFTEGRLTRARKGVL